MVERLLREGHEVWVLAVRSTGAMSNIYPYVTNSHFHYKFGSVLDEPLVGESVDRADVVFHLAAAVGVKLIVEQPARTIETNVRGTEVVLSAAAKKQKLTVVASTSEVYVKGVKILRREDDLCSVRRRRIAGYSCSKAIDEMPTLRTADADCRRSSRASSARSGRRTGRWHGRAELRQAIRGEDITVYGTGDQRRCFADARDVVECLLRLVATPKAIGQVFNVGSDHEISINQLAELVRTRSGGHSKIRHVPYEEAYAEGFEDLQRRVPDLRKLEATIGYRPTSTIESIVDAVIADARERGD